MAVTPGWVGSNSSTSTSNPLTFPTEPIGAASADRLVVVSIDHRSNGANPTGGVTGVTIAGVTATLLTFGGTDASIISGRNAVSMWIAAVPTGTTGDIVITFADAPAQTGIGVWAMTGASATPTDVDVANANNIAALTVNTNGAAIVGAHNASGSTMATVTGATMRYNNSIAAGVTRSGGSDTVTSGTNTITVTNASQVIGVAFGVASTAYTLACDLGTYTYTGIAALWGRGMAATVGAYSLTGVAAAIKNSMIATAGSYTLTGIDALFVTGKGIVAEAGAYAVNGVAAAINLSMNAIAGSYTLTGQAAVWGRGMAAAVGTYALTGVAALAKYSMNAITGTYALTGIAAGTLRSILMAAAVGTYTLTGQAVVWGRSMFATAGSYVYSGFAAVLTIPTVVISQYLKRRHAAFSLAQSRVREASLSQRRSVRFVLSKLRGQDPRLED